MGRRGTSWITKGLVVGLGLGLVSAGLSSRLAGAGEVATGAAQSASQLGTLAKTGAGIETFQTDLFTGRATTALPLSTPPGRRIQPSLALSYGSGGENGWLGLGWSLGLGSIERSTKSGVPTYDDTKDTFTASVNGVTSDLVQIAPGEYRMEIEPGTFLRFQYDGQRWLVTDKAGTQYFFGSDPSCRQTTPRGTFAWLLCKIQDRLGNSLEVTYTLDQGELYLQEIRYTGFAPANEVPPHKVEFLLEPRPDPIVSYRTGAKVVTAQRLKEVRTSASGALARVSRLSYTQDPATQRSLLSSVTECGTDGTTCLPPIRFTYTQTTPQFASLTNRGPIEALGDSRRSFCRWTTAGGATATDLVDLDGDGWPDRLHADDGWTNWQVQRGTPTGYGTLTPWGPIPHLASGVRDAFPRFTEPNAGDNNQSETWVDLIDMTGDGRPERIVVPQDWTSVWRIQRNTGTGFAAPEDWPGVAQFGPVAAGAKLRWSVRRAGGESDVVGVDLIDLTGDGLPDRVFQAESTPYTTWSVQRNTGTGFAPPAPWGPIRPHPQTSYWLYSFPRVTQISAGIQQVDLVDLNGDGLPDRVIVADHLTDPMQMWVVQWNTGSGFTEPQAWGPVDTFGYGRGWARGVRYLDGNRLVMLDLVDLNSDGLPDRLHAPRDGTTWSVQFNTGTGFTAAQAWTPIANEGDPTKSHCRAADGGGMVYCELADISGDGVADRLLATEGNTSWRIQQNVTAPPGLLQMLDNGRGGTLTITYAPSTGQDNTAGDGIADLPFPVWVVRQVTTANGLGWSATTSYAYQDGLFEPKTKEFRGFGRASVTDPEGTVATTWFHQDAHRKGKPQRVEVRDAAGQLYAKTESVWQCCEQAGLPGHQGCTLGVHFNALLQQDTWTYDGEASAKQTRTRFTYDVFGNVLTRIEEGDVADPADDRQTVTEYVTNDALWLVGLPKRTTLADAAGTSLAQQTFSYDGATSADPAPTVGLLTKQDAWLNTGPANPTTTFTYDAYGNVLTTTDALGRQTTTTYDAALHTYPLTITNALGQAQSNTYDAKTGQLLSATDPNGQTTTSVYDVLGRLTALIGPLDTAAVPGVTYSYDLASVPNVLTKTVRTRSTTAATSPDGPIALPSLAAFEPATLTTASFIDGLGHTVQVKSPAEDPTKQIISGQVTFTARGQVKEQYQPYLVTASAGYAAPDLTQPHETFAYDPVGRVTTVTHADGTSRAIAYHSWTTATTDEKGHRLVSLANALGQLIEQQETNGPVTTATRYTYDRAGRLTRVTDAQANVTTITYDSLGRKMALDDPDTGRWTYAYDAVGNLTQQTDAKGQALTFQYDLLNRLTKKFGAASASATPTLLAEYTYDLVVPNGIGRLGKLSDATGTSEFHYDTLGREVKTTKTLATALATEAGQSLFVIARAYDALDRVVTLTYPDGTIVHTTYNAQGLPEAMGTVPSTASSSEGTVPIVKNADYAPTGQQTRLELGNGTVSAYQYDPARLWLKQLETVGATSTRLQLLQYTFDPVGNVSAVTDQVHGMHQTFTYDDLNRLIRASGPYGAQSFRYDAIGNLLEKAGVLQNYGMPDPVRALKGPHCVTSLVDGTRFDYDPNGAVTYHGKSQYAFTYDVENRLITVAISTGAPLARLERLLQTMLAGLERPFVGTAEADPLPSTLPPRIDFRYDADGGRLQKLIEGGARTTYLGALYERRMTGASPAPPPPPPPPSEPPGATLLTTSAGVVAAPAQLAVSEPSIGTARTATGLSLTLGWNALLTEPAASAPPPPSPAPVPPSKAVRHVYFGAQHVATVEKDLISGTVKTFFYHPDHLGSTNLITDASGNVVQHLEFDPWGKVHHSEGPAVAKRHLYTGKEVDETGLIYFGARYYDPALGRWIQPDAIVQFPDDPQTLNRYTYVRNNPLRYIDPHGFGLKDFFKKVWKPLVAVAVGIATAGWLSGLPYALTEGLTLFNIAMGAVAGAATYGGMTMAERAMFPGGLSPPGGITGSSLVAGIAPTIASAYHHSDYLGSLSQGASGAGRQALARGIRWAEEFGVSPGASAMIGALLAPAIAVSPWHFANKVDVQAVRRSFSELSEKPWYIDVGWSGRIPFRATRPGGNVGFQFVFNGIEFDKANFYYGIGFGQGSGFSATANAGNPPAEGLSFIITGRGGVYGLGGRFQLGLGEQSTIVRLGFGVGISSGVAATGTHTITVADPVADAVHEPGN